MRISLPTPISAEEVFTLFGIAIIGEITHVSLDSRTAEPRDLFFSLINDKEHIREAVARGAVYAGGRVALGVLAGYIREKTAPTVIAVTGSVGKTTVKEYVYAAIKDKISTHKSDENNNNDIGVPISILTMPPSTRALVLELGTNHKGEIEYLSSICKPDIAIITNIGTSHIGAFGSRENIAKEKLTILTHTRPDGFFIHSENLPIPNGQTVSQRELTVGHTPEKCDFCIDKVSLGEISEYTLNGHKISVFSRSEHIITASALAIAVCEAMNISIEQNFSFASRVDMPKMRQNIYCHNGVWIIDDCYNSSLESVESALALTDSFADEKKLRKIAVIGDILECGAYAKKIHETLGILCARHGLDTLIAFGEDSVYTAAAALASGMRQDKVFFLRGKNHRAISEIALSVIKKDDILLFKASREMRCEKIIEYIKEEIY